MWTKIRFGTTTEYGHNNKRTHTKQDQIGWINEQILNLSFFSLNYFASGRNVIRFDR